MSSKIIYPSLPQVGEVRLVAPAVAFGRSRNEIRTAPPTLGEHTQEILGEVLEFNDTEIKQLKDDGVVQ